MAEEFEGIDRLKRLKDDAKRTAALLEASKPAPGDTLIEIPRTPAKNQPVSGATQQPQQETVALQPVSLSTLVFVATKKRLARAAHLQAASDLLPNTQWEIVDQAINEWCEKNGY
jgi:hypothetical protein